MEKGQDVFEGFDTFDSAEAFMSASEEVATGTTVEEVVTAASEEGDLTTEEAKQKEIADQEALEREVFGDFIPGVTSEESEEEDDAGEGTNTETSATATGKSTPKHALELLKEKGLVEFELEDNQELTDELAEELTVTGWETSLEREIDSMIEDLPEEGKGLLKIASKGGNVGEYLKTLVSNATAPINKDTDMTVEANQILAIETDLRNQEYDQEYIDTHVQNLKDANKLEAMSQKVFAKITKAQADKEAAQIVAAEANTNAQKENVKKHKVELTETLSAIDNIKGLVFNAEDKKELPAYISTPTVQLTDGRLITQMQHDLFKAMANKDTSILLAKLVKSNFDFSSISNATITAYSKGIKDNVQNAKNGVNKEVNSSGSSHKVKKSLADRLN